MEEKKVAAVMTAVMNYIKTEEEMAYLLSTGQVPAEEPEIATARTNHWGMHGRQTMMSMRTMMQMKTFHGSR